MRKLFLFLIILSASVWLGLNIQKDSGYVLLAYQQWTVEMPLWVAAAGLLLGFSIIYALIRLLSATGSLSRRLRAWSLRRRSHQSRSLTIRGLIELTEGRWKNAERDLLKAVHNSDTPLLNYLAAARAAQEQGADQRRDKYLQEAYESTPEAEMAVGLTQAQLQLSHKQLEQALATLRRLQHLEPNHPYVLNCLKRLYLKLQDWENLAELLPQIKKKKIIDSKEYEVLEEKVYAGIIEKAANVGDLDLLKKTWERIPRHLHKNTRMVCLYAKQLIACKDGINAAALLNASLKKKWDDVLVNLYGLANGANLNKQLTQAEAWLKQQPNNPVLLLCLGRLAARAQIWGKARGYLEQSIQSAPSSTAYAALAKLCDDMNEPQAANEYYRKGLLLEFQQ